MPKFERKGYYDLLRSKVSGKEMLVCLASVYHHPWATVLVIGGH